MSNCDDIGKCWIFAILWWPFWKWRPVEIVQCEESIRDIIFYPHVKWHWNRAMLNLCGIVVAILKMATGRNFSMSGINSGHHFLPTYQILMISDNVEFLLYCGGHFENECWPVEIVQCRESIRDIIIYPHIKLWWYRTMLNFCDIVSGHNSGHHYLDIGKCWIFAILWWPFWKWRPVEIVQCEESIRDIIIYPHVKWHWNRAMLNLCGIVVAILKMATGRNFSMSGINSGHHFLPTYQILMISDNVEFLRYCGGHFENGDQ